MDLFEPSVPTLHSPEFFHSSDDLGKAVKLAPARDCLRYSAVRYRRRQSIIIFCRNGGGANSPAPLPIQPFIRRGADYHQQPPKQHEESKDATTMGGPDGGTVLLLLRVGSVYYQHFWESSSGL